MSLKHLMAASCAASALLWAGGAAAQSAGNNEPPQTNSAAASQAPTNGPTSGTTNSTSATQPAPVGSPPGTSRPANRGGSQSDPYATAPGQQDTNASSATEVSEVVVTANKRADTVQTVPVAVSAFTDERRNLLGITTARDITNFTPSMNLQGEFLTLRGVGRYENPGQGADPGVAVYVDGVYTSSPAYLNQPDFMTDRIEVLRGPQSIFGRNALGGSVDIISKRPTADFHTDLRAGYTTDEFGYLDAAVSGPITDTLRFRLAYAFGDTQPYGGPQTNLASAPNPNTGDTRLLEGQLEWDPSPDFNLWIRYQNYSENIRGAYGVLTGLGGGTGLASPYYTSNFYNGYIGLAPNPYYGLNPNSNVQLLDPFTVNVDYPGQIAINDDDTLTVNATWDMHWATLKYLGGVSAYTYYQLTDADMTARQFETSPGGFAFPNGHPVATDYLYHVLQSKSWYSHELDLTSPNEQRFKWVLGLYYFWERYKTFFSYDDPLATYFSQPVSSLTPGPNGALPLAAPDPYRSFYDQTTHLRTQSEAVFGQVDYDFTDTFRISAGFRYNWDQRQGDNAFRYVYDLYGFFGDFGVPQVALDVTPAAHFAAATGRWSDWTGKFGAEWRPNSSMMGYAFVAKGYKSGGFNLANFVPVPVVKPETLIDYEAGLKKTWGKWLLIDGAIYYYDYKNLQIPLTVGVPGAVTPGNPNPGFIYVSSLANAQKARSYGLELESVWSPVDNFHITFVYSYLNARFLRFTSPTPGGVIQDTATGTNYADLRGNIIPQSPENKITVSPQYVAHFAAGDLSLSANYTWNGATYYSIFTTPFYRASAYYNLDLRAVFQPNNSHFTFLVYGRNVTNQLQYVFKGNWVYPFMSTYTVSEGRSAGFEVQYKF